MNLQNYEVRLAAGDAVTIHRQGNYIRGVDAEGVYSIELDDGAAVDWRTGLSFRTAEPFSKIRLTNTDSETQTVAILVAGSDIDDTRPPPEYGAPIFRATGAELITAVDFFEVLTATPKRKSVIVQNKDTGDMWLSHNDTGTTNAALLLPAGASVRLNTTAAIYLRGSNANAKVALLEEIAGAV